ncbi:DUF6493 family protein [Flavobacterium sp.]|jgi:hypothetical protein|uniref:DUF6493 family protein n=1 Tax=Flavobacterium sp. TaxID=239 RepID=UPI0037BED6E6
MEWIRFYKNKNGFSQIIEKRENVVLYSSFNDFYTYNFDNESEAIIYFKNKEKELLKEGFKVIQFNVIQLPEQLNSFEHAIEFYNKILEAEAIFSVFDFLKLIDKSIKSQFVKELKLYRKFLNEFNEERGLWGKRGTDIQIDIVAMSAMALMSKTDVKSWTEVYSLLKNVKLSFVENIIIHFKPNWLNDFVLEQTLKSEWGRISYQQLLYLEEKKYINYNQELFALCLSNIEFWGYSKVIEANFLFENKLSYQRDIPLLFDYPTNINNYSTKFIEGEKQEKAWISIIELLVAQGKIDRNFVIEKCIDIQAKNWNNGQLGFFRTLLENLKPTNQELISFQNQLFLLLPISNKIVFNFAVKTIKKIAFDDDAFNKSEFLEWTSSILSNFDAKTSIISILQIFEKYAKLDSSLIPIILQKTTEVFIINDYEVQQRASNLIVKYANKEDVELIENLSIYKSQMIGSIAKDLSFLIGESDAEFEDFQMDNFHDEKTAFEFGKISVFENWDDIFYAIGNAINSNNPIDFELVLNAFLTQKDLFPSDFSEKLKIYNKSASENYKGKAARYDLTVLINLILNNGASKVNFSDDDESNKLLLIRKHLIEYILNLYNSKKNVSMLSMPTHYPCFIEANTLLERLINYEIKNVKINHYDLMIAINRMIRKFDSESSVLINKLSEKYKNLFEIISEQNDEVALEKANNLLSQNKSQGKRNVFQKAVSFVAQQHKKLDKVSENILLNQFEITDKSFYDCAIMTSRLRLPFHHFDALQNSIYKDIPFAFSDCKANLSNESVVYTYLDYYRTTKYEEKIELVSNFKTTNEKTYFYYSYNIKNPKTKYTDYWEYAYNYSEGLSVYDIKTYFGLMPFYTEPIFAALYKDEYRRASFFSEITSSEVLKTMLQPYFNIGYFSNWFLVCSQLADKKEIRLLSSEVVLHLIENKQLDWEEFTLRIIELHQSKYATIQRYIENLSMLKNVSSLHNNFLIFTIEKLLIAFTKEEKAPTNTKKLVETLYDLKVKSNESLSEELKASLEKWKHNATLKKLIDNLLKL